MQRLGLTIAAAIAFTIVAWSRLAHMRLVWIEEAYGMAAAAGILQSKELYSSIWFDKPPIYAWFYVLSGATSGLPLRIAGIVLVLTAAGCVWLLARELWGSAEAALAAGLLCFSLTFWIQSAVIAVAPDLLMIAPASLAVLFAIQRRPWLAGILAGICVLCNSKGMIIVGVVLLWTLPDVAKVLAGFLGVQAALLLVVPPVDYWREVWVWGFGYSRDTFVTNPFSEGIRRTVSWMAFHLTISVGAAVCLIRERNWKLLAWLGLSLIAVCGGLRFFPRYYFALLPVMTVVGARGLLLLPVRWRLGVCALLLIPLVRFGPRYFQTEAASWSDTALMEDSRRCSQILKSASRPGDKLFVWGYRPDVYVFSELPAATMFLDSQPLTGVLADRHLSNSQPTFPDIGIQNRRNLTRETPEFIVDGLGPLNASLAISGYENLRGWLRQYEELAHTRTTVIYRRRASLGQ
ncbi:MAG: glycosyltransferase family 39 protein [Bryobacteraceae bacterium]|nr:glycosyltransferase family 39 protein [Bryobacteraceae bacterium]